MFGGREQVVNGNASAICDPGAEICVSGLQFQKCEALNTSARVQALFCENRATAVILDKAQAWRQIRFISTDSLLTLEKLLNFPALQFHHL